MELKQILVLQQKNLAKNLTEGESYTEGFLTVEHTFELLKKMNTVAPHILAIDQGQVVGYALSMSPKFGDEIDILRPMFAAMNKLTKGKRDYMVMGQICIAKHYRGQGLFRGLYTTMQQLLPATCTTIITEVATSNTRSLQAHTAIGFRELKRYFKANQEWSLIILS
ncbi:MAG: GNAT family N-acetyltransferase [Bacteroidota bacterium]